LLIKKRIYIYYVYYWKSLLDNWNGGNGIEQDMNLGVEYLKSAALRNHIKAKKAYAKNNITF
jgi:hypothetical protein